MYQVIVGNIGQVCNAPTKKEANKVYKDYVSQSKRGYGRAAGEQVVMMHKGYIIKEHEGIISPDEPKI